MTSSGARKSHSGAYRWLVVGMLWLVCFFNYADRQAIYSVFPLLKGEMGLRADERGALGSAFMWTYALAAPFAGVIGDRFRKKALILGGLIAWSAICAATALSTRYEHLLLFRALEGLGEAFYFPASMALIAGYHGPATRSKAMALHQSSVYVGTVAGGTLGGVLGEHYGWRSSFYILGAMGIVLGMALFALLREPPAAASRSTADRPAGFDPAKIGREIREILATPMVLILMAVFVGANLVAAIFLVWMPTYLHDNFEMGLGLAGFSATAYPQFASILGVVLGGVLADRLSRRRAGGRPIVQAVGLFLGTPFVFITGWTLSVPVLIMALASFGFAKGIYDSNIWASLHDHVRPELRATAVGLMNSVAWLGGAVGPTAIGLAVERHGRSGLAAGISAVSLVYLGAGLVLLAGIALMRNRGRPGGDGGALRS
jgi:MFS family permease